MDQPYDVITFDCYGTLIDWEPGVPTASAAAAAAACARPRAAMRLFERSPSCRPSTFGVIVTSCRDRPAVAVVWAGR